MCCRLWWWRTPGSVGSQGRVGQGGCGRSVRRDGSAFGPGRRWGRWLPEKISSHIIQIAARDGNAVSPYADSFGYAHVQFMRIEFPHRHEWKLIFPIIVFFGKQYFLSITDPHERVSSSFRIEKEYINSG